MLLDQISAMEPQNFQQQSADNGLEAWLKGINASMDTTSKDIKKMASEQARFTSSFSSLFKEGIQLSKGRNVALASIDSSINRQTLQVSAELRAVAKDVQTLGRNVDAGFISMSSDLRTLGVRQDILISQNKDMIKAINALQDISFPDMNYDGFDGMVSDLDDSLQDLWKSNHSLAVISNDNKRILGDFHSDFKDFRSDFRNVMGYIANNMTSQQNQGLPDLSNIQNITVNMGDFAQDFTDTFMERWEEFMEDFRNAPPRPTPGPSPNPGPNPNPRPNPGDGGDNDSGQQGRQNSFKNWLENLVIRRSGLDASDLKNVFGDAMLIGGTIASLLTTFTSKYDENYSSMLDKLSLTTGTSRFGSGPFGLGDDGAFDARKEIMNYSRQRNNFDGRMGGLSERFKPEEYEEAMNKLLDTGISDLRMLAEATAESALSNKILPELNISSQQYFKDLMVEYEDGADRIRGVTMLVKDYSEDMWVSPTTLQDTVQRNHRAISAITKDLESYMVVMDKTIKAKGRLDQAGLDLGLDELRDQFTSNFIGNWDDGSIRKMDMMMRNSGFSREELTKLSFTDPEEFNNVYMESFWKENKNFLNSDGTFNWGDQANVDAFLNKMQNVYNMSSSDVKDAMDFLGGGYDRYKTSEGVDSGEGIIGSDDMKGAINKEAADKVEGQTNMTWQQEFSSFFGWLKDSSGLVKALDWAGLTGANVIAILGFVARIAGVDFIGLGRNLLSKFPQLGQALSSLGGKLGSLFSSGLSKLGSIFSGGLGSLGSSLLSGLSSLGSTVMGGLSSLGSTIAGGLSTIGPAVAAAAPAAAIAWGAVDFSRGVNKAKDWYGEDADGYDKAAAGVAGMLGGTGGGIFDDRSYAEKGASVVGGAAKGALAGAAIGSAIPVVGTAIGAAVGGVAGAVGSMIGGENIAKAFGWAKDKLEEGNEAVDNFLEDKLGNGGKAIADVKNGVIDGIGDVFGGVSEGVADAVGGIGSGLGKIAQGDIIGGLFDAGGGIVKGVGSAIGGVVSGVGKVGKGLWNGFKDLIGLGDDAEEDAEKATGSFKDIFEKVNDVVANASTEPILPQTSQDLVGTTDNVDYYNQEPMLSPSAYYDETALNNDLLYMPSKNLANYDNITDTSQITPGWTNEDALMAGTLSLDNKFADSVKQGNYGDLSANLYNPDKYHLGLEDAALGSQTPSDKLSQTLAEADIPKKQLDNDQLLNRKMLGSLTHKDPGELAKGMESRTVNAQGEDKTMIGKTLLGFLTGAASAFNPLSALETAGSALSALNPLNPVGPLVSSLGGLAKTVFGDEDGSVTAETATETSSDAQAIVNAITTLEQNLMIRLDSLISSGAKTSDKTKPTPDYYTPALSGIETSNDQDIRNYAM